MSLKSRINDDIKHAMKAKDSIRLQALRYIFAGIKQKEVDERVDLDDAAIVVLLNKMLKQRKDSIAQFEQAGRQELADKEKSEVKIIQAYLPEQLSSEELDAIIDATIKEVAAKSPADMGKLMAALKPKLQGKADMGQANAKVKQRLT